MIHFSIYFKLYKWNIDTYIISKGDKSVDVLTSLKQLGCSNKVLEDAMINILTGVNSGFTYSNLERNGSVIVINNSLSIQEFVDTLNHEKNHIEMHICEKYKINPNSEKAAYLSGRLAKTFFIALIDNIL